MRILFYLYHFVSKIMCKLGLVVDSIRFKIIIANPKIKTGKGTKSVGLPIIRLGKNSRLVIGNNFKMNDGNKNNFIGRDGRCLLHVKDDAELIIGNNVGMSSIAIVASNRIWLKNNIRIGGNVIIYDTDFHSLIPEERLSKHDPGIKTDPVIIEDNVFIGAHSMILKGVTIGSNSVIGAASLVSTNIPANEIWGGNPARFIRKLDDKKASERIRID